MHVMAACHCSLARASRSMHSLMVHARRCRAFLQPPANACAVCSVVTSNAIFFCHLSCRESHWMGARVCSCARVNCAGDVSAWCRITHAMLMTGPHRPLATAAAPTVCARHELFRSCTSYSAALPTHVCVLTSSNDGSQIAHSLASSIAAWLVSPRQVCAFCTQRTLCAQSSTSRSPTYPCLRASYHDVLSCAVRCTRESDDRRQTHTLTRWETSTSSTRTSARCVWWRPRAHHARTLAFVSCTYAHAPHRHEELSISRIVLTLSDLDFSHFDIVHNACNTRSATTAWLRATDWLLPLRKCRLVSFSS
jgi:hypothetical protein